MRGYIDKANVCHLESYDAAINTIDTGANCRPPVLNDLEIQTPLKKPLKAIVKQKGQRDRVTISDHPLLQVP